MKIGIVCPEHNIRFLQPYIDDWVKTGFAEVLLFKQRTDGAFQRKFLQLFQDKVDVNFVEWGLPHLLTLSNIPNHKPIIVRMHRYDAYLPFHCLIDFKQISQLLFVAKNVEQDYVSKNLLTDVPTAVIRNAADTSLFRPAETITTSNVAGVVGNFVAYKGLIEIIQIITKQRGWKLRMRCGGQPAASTDVRYQQAVIGAAHRYPNVELVPLMNHAEMPKFYQSLGVYINFSQVESNSTSVIEALACGTFVICKSWLGAREQFMPEMIVENQGQAIQKLRWWEKLSIEEKIKLSEKCRKFAVENYEQKLRFPVMKKVIEEVVK